MCMVKKIIFTLIFCLLTIPSYADHWVYISLIDKSGVKAEDDSGLMKQGDIIDILPVEARYAPSEKEKEKYKIIRVSGLTDEDIISMKETRQIDESEDALPKEQQETPVFRLKKYTLKDTSAGIEKTTITKTQLMNDVKTKTEQDFISYSIKQKYYAYVKRPIKIVGNFLVPSATAETISTINKTGEDYNTLTLWEADVDGDLVTNTTQETAEVYDDDGDLDEQVDIAGSTTNATYFMKITVPSGERHDGTASSGASIVTTLPSTAGASVIDISDTYTVVEWLVIDWTVGDRNQNGIELAIAGGYSTIQNCVIVRSSGSNQSPIGISNQATPGGLFAYNNIIYGHTGTTNGAGIYVRRLADVYNNTLYGNNYGFWHDNANSDTVNITNNIAVGNTATDFIFKASSVNDYNVSEDTTADGTNSLNTGSDSDFVSVTGGSEDLHIVTGAVGKDNGSDLGTTANVDIDGRDRNSEGDTWDMGAHEFVAAGGGLTEPFGGVRMKDLRFKDLRFSGS